MAEYYDCLRIVGWDRRGEPVGECVEAEGREDLIGKLLFVHWRGWKVFRRSGVMVSHSCGPRPVRAVEHNIVSAHLTSLKWRVAMDPA